MFMDTTDLRINTLKRVIKWNEEKAALTRADNDKTRFLANIEECSEHIMDLIRIDACRDL